jgi:hypothetical protein
MLKMKNSLFMIQVAGGCTIIVNNLQDMEDSEREEITNAIKGADINWLNFKDNNFYFLDDSDCNTEYDYKVKTDKANKIVLLTQFIYK